MLNETLVHQMMDATVQGYNDSHTRMFALKSLFISEHKRSYRVGDKVLVKEGKLINSQGIPTTHQIMLLEGTLDDSKHSITLVDTSTNEPLKIEL